VGIYFRCNRELLKERDLRIKNNLKHIRYCFTKGCLKISEHLVNDPKKTFLCRKCYIIFRNETFFKCVTLTKDEELGIW